MRVIIPKNATSSDYPREEKVRLVWGREPDKSDLRLETAIDPKIGEELLHIVFSDSTSGMFPIRDAGTRYAMISTMQNLKQYHLKVEDSFAEVDCEAELTIISEGGYCKTRASITYFVNLLTDIGILERTFITERRPVRTKYTLSKMGKAILQHLRQINKEIDESYQRNA